MSKDRPRNLAASVRHRLMELARKHSENFQFVLTRYVIERLLSGARGQGDVEHALAGGRPPVGDGFPLIRSAPK